MLYKDFGSGRALPPILYHYTSAQGLMGIIEKNTLHLSDLLFVNDTAEVSHAGTVLTNLFQEFLRIESIDPRRITFTEHEALQVLQGQHYDDPIRRPSFAFSLSEESNSLSQWRAYCPREGGYAIGFDAVQLKDAPVLYSREPFVEDEVADRTLRTVIFGPCLYTDKEKSAPLREVWNTTQSRIQLEGGNIVGSQVAGMHMAYTTWNMAPFLKEEGFHEEKEWRLVYQAPTGVPFTPDLDPRPGLVKRFIKLKFPDGLPIREIIVGPSFRQEGAYAGAWSLLMREGLSPHMLKKSNIPYRPL